MFSGIMGQTLIKVWLFGNNPHGQKFLDPGKLKYGLHFFFHDCVRSHVISCIFHNMKNEVFLMLLFDHFKPLT